MVTELMGGGDVEASIEKAPDHRLELGQAISIGPAGCYPLLHRGPNNGISGVRLDCSRNGSILGLGDHYRS